jgi:phosphoribosylformylglycinamidine cyclo-ligase
LGLKSNGVHSNGYSLVRKIIDLVNPDLDEPFDTENGVARSLREALIAPTRIYVKPLLKLMQSLTIKGMAHITGGGITENVPRVLPSNVVAEIVATSWPQTPLFHWLKQSANMLDSEFYKTFNCGIGMVVIVSEADAAAAIQQLSAEGETVYTLGRIRSRLGEEHQTQVV